MFSVGRFEPRSCQETGYPNWARCSARSKMATRNRTEPFNRQKKKTTSTKTSVPALRQTHLATLFLVLSTQEKTRWPNEKKELKRNESGHFDRFISPVIGAKETGFPSVTWHFIKVGVSDTTVHNSFDASRFLQRKETLRGRFRAQSWSVKFGENDWNYFVHNWIPVKKKLISFTWIPNTWA